MVGLLRRHLKPDQETSRAILEGEQIMEKSVLEMVGGEKHINPHYDIKAESTSCYPISEGFTGVEINGVRFSNIVEMLRYMDKQREQLIKAKDLLLRFIKLKNKPCAVGNSVNMLLYDNICADVNQFISEVEK